MDLESQGEVSAEKRGAVSWQFISEVMQEIICFFFSESIKGSVTCKALEGQVRRIKSYLDVEPLEGRYETTPRRNSRDVLRGAWI